MSTFRDSIRQKDFVVTADLPLRPTTSVADIEDSVAILAPVVDALQLVDDRQAVGHMSPLAAASIVRRSGSDAVVHITCRDRNRVALQAELLGAAALGITSLVVSRGEKLSKQDFIRGKGVFDTSETRLIEMATRIGTESNLVSVPGFLVGTCVTVFDPKEDWEAVRIRETIDAGAKVLYTQPCLNVDLLARYVAKLVERKITHRASLILDIPLIGSRETAGGYKANNPGALIPKAVTARLTRANNPAGEGVSACAEMLAKARTLPGIAGANIRHDGVPGQVVSAIREAGLEG